MTDFFLSFWPFWLLVIEESCLPFTDVLPQFRAKVTRKSGIFESGTPRVRLRQPAFVPQSRDYGESRGFGVTGYADVTDKAKPRNTGGNEGSKGFPQSGQIGIYLCLLR